MPHDVLPSEPLGAQALAGRLDEAQARQVARRDPELVALALLALARRIATLETQAAGMKPTPATPSGMIPVYAKPNALRGHRRKRPGAKDGHVGHRRPRPTRIDQRHRGLRPRSRRGACDGLSGAFGTGRRRVRRCGSRTWEAGHVVSWGWSSSLGAHWKTEKHATERAKRPSITFASLFANEKCPFSRAFSQAGDGT